MKFSPLLTRICFGTLVLVQFLAFLVIPSVGAKVFLSPDETANAVVARNFGLHGTMRIENPVSLIAPWVHPRSFISQQEFIVPVGFVGLPAIVGSLWRLFGDWALVLFTPLLVLSVIIPLWKWCAQLGRPAQMAAVLVWLSYPGVIVYANRGLFPNLVVVCFMVWSVYLLSRAQSSARRSLWLIGSGVLFGLAMMVRPVEFAWMIPWIALAAFYWRTPGSNLRDRLMSGLWWLIGFFPCLLLLFFLNWHAYGSPFAVGYLLSEAGGSLSISVTSISPPSLLPFGFHPRNVLFNVREYVFGYLSPWFLMTILGAVLSWKHRAARPFVILSIWTFVVVSLMYGQGIYQDHVGINVVSMGNSFIRYILPLVPFIALAAAVCVRALFQKRSQWGRAVACVGIALLVGMGNWMALSRDQEGMIPSATELVRYQAIRETAQETLPNDTIVLSERSDKIFFPVFRAASPLPEKWFIKDLVRNAGAPVALFSSVLDPAHIEPWTAEDLFLRPIFQVDKQMMYIVTTSSSKP
ncbi:glycosyltransferase family 39 protein [Patescibacteria group bacterium]|nr:glycosyltransferase family 39 protein [Patescibacteria group bacterium]